MSTLQQLRNGFVHAWDNLTEGWQHLRERTSHALTRFSPSHNKDQLETVENQWMQRSSRWGLLTAEIQEDDDKLIVKLEAPGMDADDFDIHVYDDILVIRGEKRIEKSGKKGNYYMTECAYGQFERAIQLPASVDENKAKAKYRRGVLRIQLPKHATSKKRVIKVNS